MPASPASSDPAHRATPDSAQQRGREGEQIAVEHLRQAGMQVLHRNWRAAVEGVRGELDIIALDGGTLAVVEVKLRSTAVGGSALQAVGWHKRRQLRRLTGVYLAAHPHPGPVRGDVVAIDAADEGWHVTHLRGVW